MENNIENLEFQQPEFQQPEYNSPEAAPEAAPAAKKDLKKILIPVVAVVAVLAIILTTVFCFIPLIEHNKLLIEYNKALNFIDSGENQEAYNLLSKNPDFQNNAELLSHFFTKYQEEICTRYDMEDGELEKQSAYKYLCEYNPDGSIKSQIVYELDLRTEEWIKRSDEKYNENGDPLSELHYDSDGEFIGKYIATYDDKGNRLTYKGYDADGEMVISYVYEYDDNDNMTVTKSYDKDGKLIGKSVSEYDEDGNKTAWKRYNADGQLQEKTLWEYDKDGNMLSEKLYNITGIVIEEYVYEYDEDGNRTMCAMYDRNGVKYEYTYKYDEYGFPISGQFIKKDYSSYGGTKTTNVTYKNTYDDNGNLIEQKALDEDNEVMYTNEIKYHDNGIPSMIIQKDAAGELDVKRTYDASGHYLIEENYYNGNLLSRHEFEYSGEVLCYNKDFYSERLKDLMDFFKH